MKLEPEARFFNVLAGLMTREQLALNLLPNRPVSQRTVIRWEQAGLPVIRLGHALRLYDPIACRNWVLSQKRRPDMPKRGRPTTKHAA